MRERQRRARSIADVAASTGTYEAIFHIGEWFRARSVTLPSPAFLEVVPFRFGVADLGAALSPAAQDDAVGLFTFPWRCLIVRHADCLVCGVNGERSMIARRAALAFGLALTIVAQRLGAAMAEPAREDRRHLPAGRRVGCGARA